MIINRLSTFSMHKGKSLDSNFVVDARLLNFSSSSSSSSALCCIGSDKTEIQHQFHWIHFVHTFIFNRLIFNEKRKCCTARQTSFSYPLDQWSLSSQQNVLQLEALLLEIHTHNIHTVFDVPFSPTTIARLHWCLNISPSSYVHTRSEKASCAYNNKRTYYYIQYQHSCFIVRIEFMNYLSMTHRVPSLLISFFGCVSTFNIFFLSVQRTCSSIFLPFPFFLLLVLFFSSSATNYSYYNTRLYWILDKNTVSLHWLARLFSYID